MRMDGVLNVWAGASRPPSTDDALFSDYCVIASCVAGHALQLLVEHAQPS
jgi:hypothetical protein